jgi:hypothetical protein
VRLCVRVCACGGGVIPGQMWPLVTFPWLVSELGALEVSWGTRCTAAQLGFHLFDLYAWCSAGAMKRTSEREFYLSLPSLNKFTVFPFLVNIDKCATHRQWFETLENKSGKRMCTWGQTLHCTLAVGVLFDLTATFCLLSGNHLFQIPDTYFLIKAKAVPLHAMKALGGGGEDV